MSAEQNSLRILMVEDADNDAALIAHELNGAGLIFQTARVVTKQRFMGELLGNPPDVILCDHALPSFDGFEALRLAQEHTPETPFIFVTGSPDEAQARSALSRGARAWVPKTRLGDLVPAVREALRLAEYNRRLRLAEKSARDHAEQVRILLDARRGRAMFTLNERGHIADWSGSAAALFGLGPVDMVDRYFGCLYTVEDRAVGKPKRDLASALGGRHEEEGWRIRRDGTSFWAHATLTARRHDPGSPAEFICVVQDRTQDRKSEEALQASEETYRRLFELCPEPLIVATEGRVALANGAARRLLGAAEPAQLDNCALAEISDDTNGPPFSRWLNEFESNRKTQAVASVETAFRRCDGRVAFTRLTAVRISLHDAPAVLLLAHDLLGDELPHHRRAQSASPFTRRPA